MIIPIIYVYLLIWIHLGYFFNYFIVFIGHKIISKILKNILPDGGLEISTCTHTKEATPGKHVVSCKVRVGFKVK